MTSYSVGVCCLSLTPAIVFFVVKEAKSLSLSLFLSDEEAESH